MTAGRWISGTVLAVINFLTFYLVGISWAITPDGQWDDDTVVGLSTAAFVGAVIAIFTAILTVIPVGMRWLRPWWFAIPVVLLILGVARVIHLGHAYPE